MQNKSMLRRFFDLFISEELPNRIDRNCFIKKILLIQIIYLLIILAMILTGFVMVLLVSGEISKFTTLHTLEKEVLILIPILLLLLFFSIKLLFTSLYICSKRLHDLGHNGKLAFLYLVPKYGAAILFYLALAKGDEEENGYGPSAGPTKPLTPWVILLFILIALPFMF